MLTGDLPNSPVAAPTWTVSVDGTAVPVQSVNFTRELGMELPDGSGGGAGGDGSVTLSPPEAVVESGVTPWRSGGDRAPLPSGMAFVSVGLSADTSWPVATGLVDAPSGSARSAAVEVDLIEPIDTLAVPLSWEPLHARSTPLGPGGPMRLIGLTNAYVVDRAFRDAGWYATPPVSSDGAVDIPMCGSLQPRHGLLEATGSTIPTFSARDSMPQGACALAPAMVVRATNVASMGNHEYFVEVDPVDATPGVVRWDIIDQVGAGKGYRLSYDQSSKVFRVQRAERSSTPGVTTVGATVAQTTLTAADHRVSVRHLRFQNQAGDQPEIQIRRVSAPASAQVNSTSLAGSYIYDQSTDWRIYLTTTGNPAVGAFGIDRPPTAWATWAHQPDVDMKFTYGSVAPLRATPRITGGTTALDIIRDQAQAEYAAWGWLEDGRAYYWSRAWMVAQPLRRTLTAQDLVDFSWTHDTTSVRSSVTVLYRHAAIQSRYYPTITCWQGRGDAVDPSSSGSVVMAPDADTDWVRVDTGFDAVGLTPGSATEWNRGRGSFWGGALVRTDDTDAWAHLPAQELLTGAITQLDDTTWSFDWTTTALPAGIEAVELRTPESTGLRRKGAGLPVLRSYGATRWLDMEVPTVTAGSARAPRLEHDVGWHVQDTSTLTALRDWLVSVVSSPRPRLSGVQIYPDPRLQIGDRVRVVDDRPGGTGADVTGLVTSKRMSGGPGRVSMTIDVVEV